MAFNMVHEVNEKKIEAFLVRNERELKQFWMKQAPWMKWNHFISFPVADQDVPRQLSGLHDVDGSYQSRRHEVLTFYGVSDSCPGSAVVPSVQTRC